jgi:hypothetical protein
MPKPKNQLNNSNTMTTTTATNKTTRPPPRSPSPPPLLPRLLGPDWDNTSRRDQPDIWNKLFGEDSDSEPETTTATTNNGSEENTDITEAKRLVEEAGAKNLYNPAYIKNKMDEQVVKCLKYQLSIDEETRKGNIRALMLLVCIGIAILAFFIPGIEQEFRSNSEFLKRRLAKLCCIVFSIVLGLTFFLGKDIPWNCIAEMGGNFPFYIVSNLAKHSTKYTLKFMSVSNSKIFVEIDIDVTQCFAPSSRPDAEYIYSKVEALYDQFEIEMDKKKKQQ